MAESSSMNPQQQAAILHGEGPLLIIAGAGTGKTTVITERIKHLILEKHIDPKNILALTFTEKAALEMEERIDVALPYGYSQLWIETFHAFCDRILRNEAIHIGLDPNYKLLTEAESVFFLKKHLFKLNLNYFRPLGNPSKFIQALLQHMSRLKDEDVSPEEYLTWTKKQDTTIQSDEKKEELEKYKELAHAYEMYEKIKAEEGVMDFSDLISNTLKLFRTRKHILQQYQKQFSYILIDEFQDTNYAQNQLAILLAGTTKNITVVGDDDQAIYRWRGAAISNMIQFKQYFPEAKIVTLLQNYRSTQTILDTAYQLIQHNNPDRLEIKENIDKKLRSTIKLSGQKVELILANNGDDETEEVGKKIIELVKKKYSFKDIAILVRANDHANAFMKCFDRMNIPYQFLGPAHLFHQEEIKDLIAYLKVLYNFEDSAAFYRVLCMPIFSIDPASVAYLLNTAKKRNMSLYEICTQTDSIQLPDDEKEKICNIIEVIKAHLGLVPTESAGKILYEFLQEIGLLQHMVESKNEQDIQKAESIALFFEKLKSFESNHDNASVFAIVDWIDLSMQMGEGPLSSSIENSTANAVNILTIHSSKGLEFPVVFIVNMVKDRFPSRERREQLSIPQEVIKEMLPVGDYHIEEERRLCYVAITRAKDVLIFTGSRFYGEGKREKKLSPFIEEALNKTSIELAQNNLLKKDSGQLSLLDLFPEEILVEKTNGITKQLPKITYLSYSQIQTFDVCPLHYKLRYLLKVPTPTTAAMSFGTSIHNVLRDFYQRQIAKNPILLNDIEDLLKINWIIEGYASKEHEQLAYEQAKKVIQGYLQKDFSPDHLPLALELPFEFFVNKLRVGGRIDRIDDLGDGRIEIIDYKTGDNIPDEKSLKNNLQLTTYALAAVNSKTSLFNKTPEQVVLSLYYLEHDKKLTTTRTLDQLEEAKMLLAQKADEIMQSDFTCSSSIFCQNCEYKMLCNVKA